VAGARSSGHWDFEPASLSTRRRTVGRDFPDVSRLIPLGRSAAGIPTS
jgi:hypothetical protein